MQMHYSFIAEHLRHQLAQYGIIGQILGQPWDSKYFISLRWGSRIIKHPLLSGNTRYSGHVFIFGTPVEISYLMLIPLFMWVSAIADNNHLLT